MKKKRTESKMQKMIAIPSWIQIMTLIRGLLIRRKMRVTTKAENTEAKIIHLASVSLCIHELLALESLALAPINFGWTALQTSKTVPGLES